MISIIKNNIALSGLMIIFALCGIRESYAETHTVETYTKDTCDPRVTSTCDYSEGGTCCSPCIVHVDDGINYIYQWPEGNRREIIIFIKTCEPCEFNPDIYLPASINHAPDIACYGSEKEGDLPKGCPKGTNDCAKTIFLKVPSKYEGDSKAAQKNQYDEAASYTERGKSYEGKACLKYNIPKNTPERDDCINPGREACLNLNPVGCYIKNPYLNGGCVMRVGNCDNLGKVVK